MLSGYSRIAVATLRWWIVLTLLAIASLYLSSSTPPALRSWWGFLQATASQVWLTYPFVAFAGVLARSRLRGGPRPAVFSVMVTTILLGGVAHLVGVIVEPVAELEADRAAGIAVEARYPFGAQTPQALARQRAAVLERAPRAYRFSVGRPLEHPPNWLMYLIHQPMALYAFGVLNALLGLLVGWSTHGLSPPRRRHMRWLLGIVSGLAFYIAATGGTEWVRASPENSGMLGAWLPLGLPALALVGALVLWHSRAVPNCTPTRPRTSSVRS